MLSSITRIYARFYRRFNRVLMARAKAGPYRFLIRKWDSVTDINLLADVIATEYFRQELKPVALPIDTVRSYVVIAPHQDDEVIGAGGLMLLAKANNARLDIIFCTDGSDGTDDLVAIRRKEAQRVTAELGATMRELGISNHTLQTKVTDVRQLAKWLIAIRPQVVLIPWLLDRPAKHRFANLLLYLASCTDKLPSFEVWGYQVHNTLYPNGYIDITSVANEKRALIQHYASQNAAHHYDHRTMGMNAWNNRLIEPTDEPKYVETFFTLPANDYLQLIRQFYFGDLDTIYANHSSVIAAAQAIQKQIMKMN